MDNNEALIEEVIKHLDSELELGAMKMTVEVDEGQEEYSRVSHKCCKAYGRDATAMIAELDAIHDAYLREVPGFYPE